MKLIIVNFVVLLVLSSPNFILGQHGAVDFTTGRESSHSGSGTISLHSLTGGTRQGAVLWDTTHGAYLQYRPQQEYSNICQMLVDSGFTVDCCGTGVHTVDLSLYDIIVVAVTSNWYSVYTAEEVDTLVSFYNAGHQRIILTGDCNFCDNSYMPNVDNNQFAYNIFEWLSQGGGIFIMGENTGCPNANVRPVSQAFNLDNGVGALGTVTFSNYAAHPVFNSVSAIYYIAPGEISASAPSQVIGWTDGTNIPTVAARDEAIGIELETFTAFPRGDGIILKWETSCEMHNAAWRLDRRVRGDIWKNICVEPSVGNAPDGSGYSYGDDEVDPSTIQTYRLGTIDCHGEVSWLAFLKVDSHMLGISGRDGITRISPNPFSGMTEIELQIASDQGFSSAPALVIYDVTGRQVRQFQIQHSQFPIVISWDGTDDSGMALPSGVYFCRFYSGSQSSAPNKVILLE